MSRGPSDPDETTAAVERALRSRDRDALGELTTVLATLDAPAVVDVLGRLSLQGRAVVYRLLPKDLALEVFEGLDPTPQGELVQGLQAEEVAEVFAELEPDDRVSLLDELPAAVASRLLRGLAPADRDLTAVVLGYPPRSIGRRMSSGFVATRRDATVAATLERIRARLGPASHSARSSVRPGSRSPRSSTGRPWAP